MRPYWFFAGISAAGLVAALLIGEELTRQNSSGVPRIVVAAGAAALLIVAESMRLRGQGPGELAALWRSLALPYAAGSACASLVAILAFCRLSIPELRPFVVTFRSLVLIALAALSVRAAYRLSQMVRRLKTREMKAAAGAAAGAVASVAVAVVLGPPDSALAAAIICGFVYGANAAAPVVLLTLIPRPNP